MLNVNFSVWVARMALIDRNVIACFELLHPTTINLRLFDVGVKIIDHNFHENCGSEIANSM